ncbi:hypothetical protein QFC20_007264 [Naganishia adeliensis]|uniref:Uncharacterized protein n=1 Tax=Naganishia adeliensis TaxID=92952 RepID=A0ACC2V1X2_9TREE|nr:hypothetical protein QFC20_007264 [Naganishia adeliensis]
MSATEPNAEGGRTLSAAEMAASASRVYAVLASLSLRILSAGTNPLDINPELERDERAFLKRWLNVFRGILLHLRKDGLRLLSSRWIPSDIFDARPKMVKECGSIIKNLEAVLGEQNSAQSRKDALRDVLDANIRFNGLCEQRVQDWKKVIEEDSQGGPSLWARVNLSSSGDQMTFSDLVSPLRHVQSLQGNHSCKYPREAEGGYRPPSWD